MANALTVCILTAGKGTRMANYCDYLHKALLPLGKQAIISRIINKFPAETEFIVALGDKASQVQTYLEIAHPKSKFKFVEIDNFDGPGSGPGYSLLKCSQHLERPFFFVACDTLWEGKLNFPTQYDWFGVADVNPDHSAAYCNFEVDGAHQIIGIHDKERVEGPQFSAFVGLCFVKNYDAFWQGLKSATLIKGEHQVSNGIRALVDTKQARVLKVDWIDTGDAKRYEAAVKRFENFDFSKFNEALYITDNRVIKYFGEANIADKRVKRVSFNSQVFPAVSEARNGFYYYNFVPGETLYQRCNSELFGKLLSWLDQALWKEVKVDQAKFVTCCDKFYRQKSLERIKAAFKKYPDLDQLKSVNGEALTPVPQLLEKIPWDEVSHGKSVFFHGDLQFDNILYDVESDKFKLLDWRQEFAGELEFGDLYYDLAKLYGGLILNYDYIKAGMFSYQETDGAVWLDFAQRVQSGTYQKQLEQFVRSRGLDWKKVQLLVPIIFLNMSPLHHYPFDKFLFALGCLNLQKQLHESDR